MCARVTLLGQGETLMRLFRYGSLVFAAAVLVEAQTPSVAENGVLNAASYANPASPGSAVAPGSLVSIFGSNLAPDTATANSLPLPASLAGVR